MNLGFDISGILSEDEAEKLFEETPPAPPETETEEKEPENEPPAEEPEKTPEEVGEEENEKGEDTVPSDGDGSSPNVYSSIASALKNDGIFPDFEDSELESVQTPEDFAELFEKAISSRLDAVHKRINDAMNNGMSPDRVRSYEQTLGYLNQINDEAISAEGEEGDNLRRQLLYNDLVNRGYTQEKAQKEIEKSFRAGTDVEDAKDALEALTKFYEEGYQKEQDAAKKQAETIRENQKKQARDFKKLVLEDELKLGDTKLDKRTCQRIYDAVATPVHKDPDSGQLLTEVQKYQKEHPLEFLKQLGMWFVLTDGGKNIDGFTKDKVKSEKNKSIRELASKINTTSIRETGSLHRSGWNGEDKNDILLSDDWQVGSM